MVEKMQAAKSKTEFSALIGQTGTVLQVLDTPSNYKQAQESLLDAKLKPVPYQKLIPVLLKDPILMAALEGKSMWVAHEGQWKDHQYKAVGEGGKLMDLSTNDNDITKLVHVYSYPTAIRLTVHKDPKRDGRFSLLINDDASEQLIVVGVQADSPLLTGKSRVEEFVDDSLKWK
jgi:hypothetical protein